MVVKVSAAVVIVTVWIGLAASPPGAAGSSIDCQPSMVLATAETGERGAENPGDYDPWLLLLLIVVVSVLTAVVILLRREKPGIPEDDDHPENNGTI